MDWVLDPITKWFSFKIIYCSIYITVLTRCIVGVREDEQLLGTGTTGLEDELAANTRLKFGDIQAHILTVVVVVGQPTVGSVTLGPVVLGCIRKQGEQVMRTRLVKHSCMASASASVSRFVFEFPPGFTL